MLGAATTMENEFESTLAAIEETQPVLRESIETAKLLTEEADRLIRRNRPGPLEECGKLD